MDEEFQQRRACCTQGTVPLPAWACGFELLRAIGSERLPYRASPPQ